MARGWARATQERGTGAMKDPVAEAHVGGLLGELGRLEGGLRVAFQDLDP